jgi:hypothetical protein
MIVVDPTKRLDSGNVVKYSQEMLNQLRSSPKIDPILVTLSPHS